MQRIYRLVPSDIVRGPVRIDIAFPEAALAYRKHPEERLYLVPTADVYTSAQLLATAGVRVFVGLSDVPVPTGELPPVEAPSAQDHVFPFEKP